MGMPSRRTNNFPESGRGPGHVTLQFLEVRSAILATAWLLVITAMCILCTVHPPLKRAFRLSIHAYAVPPAFSQYHFIPIKHMVVRWLDGFATDTAQLL